MQKLTSCRTILHEKFDASNTANGYDIALLELDTKSAKTPIKIDEAIGRKAKGQVRAIGWGKNAEKRFFVELQEVDFTVVNNTKCGKQIFPGILDSMMCAQGNSSDVCKGDYLGQQLLSHSCISPTDVCSLIPILVTKNTCVFFAVCVWQLANASVIRDENTLFLLLSKT